MEQFAHGGNVYDTPTGRAAWLDFSANINPLGLSPLVRDAIGQNIDGIVHYPDPQGRELKSAIARFYHVPMEQIVLGNGAAELLYVFFHRFRPGHVLIPVPSFNEYERAAISAGAHVTYCRLSPAHGFRLDWDALLAKLPEHGCAVIGNPNNPTGELLKKDDLMSCLRMAKARQSFIIVDESFMDFRDDAEEHTLMDAVAEYDNLFLLQSMTKFYALPGLRLGFGLLAKAHAHAMECSKDPWNVNLLAQKAGVAALADTNYQEDSRRFVAEEARWLAGELQRLRLAVQPPTVNFLFCGLHGTGWLAGDFTAAMRKKGILVRDCSNYPGLDARYIRVAVRQRGENAQLLAAMQEILEPGNEEERGSEEHR